MSLITEFEPGFTANGALPAIVAFRQADTQTFTQGQALITVDASGAVTEAGGGAADVLGISADNADNGTADTKVGVWVLDNNTIFKAAPTLASTVAVADIFNLIDLDTTGGLHTADRAATTDEVFYVVDISAVGGRLFVKAGHGSSWSNNGALVFV